MSEQQTLFQPRTQSERILDRLERAGDKGVLNTELNQIAFRYSARIFDLKRQGYQISAIPVKGSIYRFVLHKGAL